MQVHTSFFCIFCFLYVVCLLFYAIGGCIISILRAKLLHFFDMCKYLGEIVFVWAIFKRFFSRSSLGCESVIAR